MGAQGAAADAHDALASIYAEVEAHVAMLSQPASRREPTGQVRAMREPTAELRAYPRG